MSANYCLWCERPASAGVCSGCGLASQRESVGTRGGLGPCGCRRLTMALAADALRDAADALMRLAHEEPEDPA